MKYQSQAVEKIRGAAINFFAFLTRERVKITNNRRKGTY
jgi:hypothetical protein